MNISNEELTKRIQVLLNKYCDSSLSVDGKYGPLTDSAYNNAIDDKEVEYENIDEPRTAHFTLEEYYSNQIVNGVKKYKVVMPPKELWPYIQKSMDMLEKLRSMLGDRKIHITSGYRAPEYNEWLYEHSTGGGVAKNSPHMRGTATDIQIQGLTPKEVYDVADKLYADGGVGLYDSFVHVDLDYENKRPARW